MKLTDEQQKVCDANVDILKVSAFAGTGKTSTLRAYAESRSDKRILYVAFNKAIQREAQGKFPRHVVARTAHSIAYGKVGRHYVDKLQGNIKPFHILPHLGGSTRQLPSAACNLYGGRVIETVKAFLVSGDMAMDTRHVCVGDSPVERKHFSAKGILADAQRVWEMMQDRASDVPMLHDGYLKLFQLSGQELPYDIVLLDEAQDTNPVTQAIVSAQPGRKVYVGDRHQAIYGFRGASNAMAEIKADATLHLTGSFRFGEAVADVANQILALKDEGVALRGLGGPSELDTLPRWTPHAYIARGNAALFHRAVQALEADQSFAFVGDLRNYRLDLMEDTWRVATGEEPRDPFLRSFDDFDALQEYADSIGDKEVMGRCRTVSQYGTRIPGLVRLIQKRALPSLVPGEEASNAAQRPQVVLSSAHRSKGMEFDCVRLADDFMDLLDEEGRPIDLARADAQTVEEVNLQYVAATRARKVLEVGEKLNCYLETAQSLGNQPFPIHSVA